MSALVKAHASKPYNDVIRRHYSGKVGDFIIYLCEISSRFCKPKIIKIGSFFAELLKYKGGVF